MTEVDEVKALHALEHIEALHRTFEALPAGESVPAEDVAALFGGAGVVMRATLPDLCNETGRTDHSANPN